MDRNTTALAVLSMYSVALRKESVDRNIGYTVNFHAKARSLSARRAWIEIPAGCWRDARRASLSARRAWIEICGGVFARLWALVALRKESVDRNSSCIPNRRLKKDRRSPQGERG